MQHCTLLAGLTAMKGQTILGEDSMVKLKGKQCIHVCIVLSVSCQYCIVVYKYLYQVFVLIS